MSLILPSYPLDSSSPPTLEKRKRQHELEIPLQVKRKALNAEDRSPAKVVYRASSSSRVPFADDDDNNDDDEDIANSGSLLSSLESRNSGAVNTALVFVSTLPKLGDRWQQCPAHQAKTSSGKTLKIPAKKTQTRTLYGQVVAERSDDLNGKAVKSYYGIDVHKLLDEASKYCKNDQSKNTEAQHSSTETSMETSTLTKLPKKGQSMLWTEKYRARKFTDLVGDERTHRDVLRWLKGWDSIVFPDTSRLKPNPRLVGTEAESRHQRKILLLTGPPGLGKTTLAHVCARQAGYEVVEINASDERSRSIVGGRIKDCLGTENVKGINVKDASGSTRKAGRPVCVIVDEADGVVSGSSGGGEGGFIKALIDLVTLDRKNSNVLGPKSANVVRSKKKGGRFRILRPMILICNDAYHPALRLLRASTMAEMIHIRKPPLDKVVARLKSVFDKEGVACDTDGVRRLCEAIWGVSATRGPRKSSIGTGEGDIRGILVVSQWVAAKLRASAGKPARLTKKWVEEHMLANLSHEGGEARGLGRGGAKEVAERIFLDGAGFPAAALTAPNHICKVQSGGALGVSELTKQRAITQLRGIVDACGESDRIMTQCFIMYPSRSFQDDTFLSKPNAAHEWLHFHDLLSSKVYGGQEWELGPYCSQPILGFHHLFASTAKHAWANQNHLGDDEEEEAPPFSGPRADYLASEALKQNKSILLDLQSSLSCQLLRSFRSAEDISTDLLPSLIRMLTPSVKPIIVGGSSDQERVVNVRNERERETIQRAVGVMAAVGVTLERARIEMGQSGLSSHIYRMEPPLEKLAVFETACQSNSTTYPTRYAICQALDQEYQKYILRQRANVRQAKCKPGDGLGSETATGVEGKEHASPQEDGLNLKPLAVKRDFFRRIIGVALPPTRGHSSQGKSRGARDSRLDEEGSVWVSYHEGFSNAVRKPITLDELMQAF